jgi:hypothetical protein
MGRNYYGYRNYISIDVETRLIRAYSVTDDATYGSQVFDELVDDGNMSREVFADAAYRSKDRLQRPSERGFLEQLQLKGQTSSFVL